MTYDLRLGRFERVLADVRADCLITDTPWSEATHRGHYEGLVGEDEYVREDIPYRAWTPDDVLRFVALWAPRTRGWFVSLTDDVLLPVWRAALEAEGRQTFADVPFIHPGSRVRIRGDGPSSWATHIVVARPRTREFAGWGTLDGGYTMPKGLAELEREIPIIGGKPLWLLRQLVRDYSRPGDVIVDPCAGAGTTLLAAVVEGRRGVGAEMDRKHFAIAKARLDQVRAA